MANVKRRGVMEIEDGALLVLGKREMHELVFRSWCIWIVEPF